MKIKHFFSMLAVVAASFTSVAHADVHYDAHGNVGYDTAAECDAAVHAGTAKFYESFTHKPPLVRKGEKGVQSATLKDLGEQYAKGACDLGVGKKLGRDGVSRALQGKFIPFSPDMPVNVYTDASGNAVRVSMKQCDNWFSGNAPRPVENVQFTRPEPVVETTPVAPVTDTLPSTVKKTSPALTASLLAAPYVFGTIGMHNERLSSNGKQPAFYNRGVYDDNSRTVTGQLGVGLQLNQYLGGEIYVEGGKNKEYTSNDGKYSQDVKRWLYGTRLTLGTDLTEQFRLFGKAGVAAVHQDDFHPQFLVGVGGTYNLTDALKLRADVDHYIKRSKHTYYDNMGFSKSVYFGVGLQYNFK